MADFIRAARLHPLKSETDDFYRGWNAGLRRLMAEVFTGGSTELRGFDALSPSKLEMNRKPRAR